MIHRKNKNLSPSRQARQEKQKLMGDSFMFSFDRITFEPNIMGGEACVRGMRISVSLVVNLVANGMSFSEILAEYPDLELEDIQQALRYVGTNP